MAAFATFLGPQGTTTTTPLMRLLLPKLLPHRRTSRSLADILVFDRLGIQLVVGLGNTLRQGLDLNSSALSALHEPQGNEFA